MTPDCHARLTALRHELHRHPEISGQEQETAARIVQRLQGYTPDQILTGLGGHGVAALFDSGNAGPTVAIRCELDALPIQEVSDAHPVSQVPGKGHLCGHDGHMVMVLGVGEALQEQPPQSGRVLLIFQPAEETGQGAAALRADPRFETLSPDYVLSLHNLPGLELGSVEICTESANCASRGMRIRLWGKTSHAAAPQDGRSPAAAMAELMPQLASLGQGGALDETYALTTLTHANLGEATFGVAPGYGEIWVTLRTVSDARMAELMTAAETLVQRIAVAQGLRVEITYDDIFEACSNDPKMAELLQKACRTVGVPCEMTRQPQRFSEDFGQFSKSARTAMFWLGSGLDQPQLHNPDYNFPDALIPIGTGIFTAALRDLLEN